MKYKATVTIKGQEYTRTFDTMSEAAGWIDSQNNRFDAASFVKILKEENKHIEGAK